MIYHMIKCNIVVAPKQNNVQNSAEELFIEYEY
jgi:hypothetical protein